MMPFAELASACAEEAAQRAGFGVNAAFPPCWNAAPPSITVYDDVLPNAHAHRAALLRRPFADVVVGPAVFHGLASLDVGDPLTEWIADHLPALKPSLTFARRSPEGQAEPNYIHTDVDMGEWTGILYLNPMPATGDGTTFWQHRGTGARQSQARTQAEGMAEGAAWRDASQWAPWAVVPAIWNRLVVFAAPAFHSRAIAANYGTGANARLIQVMFGRGRA